jgi:hypothetical protein
MALNNALIFSNHPTRWRDSERHRILPLAALVRCRFLLWCKGPAEGRATLLSLLLLSSSSLVLLQHLLLLTLDGRLTVCRQRRALPIF